MADTRFRAAALLLFLLVGSALTYPWIATARGGDYAAGDLDRQLQPPGRAHPFGTDLQGRDLFLRVIYGGRWSFAVALAASLVSLVLGVGWGAIAGYAGGALDAVMMRAVDALYGLPYVFFVILLMTISRDPVNLFIGLGAVQWLTMARVVRGQVLALKGRDYVTAARAAGASHAHIVLRHILPGLAGIVAVYLSLQVPQAMRAEAFLSFLGLGIQAPQASWGNLAADGLAALNPLRIDWWLLLFPGAALAITLYALSALGDALRDALDLREMREKP